MVVRVVHSGIKLTDGVNRGGSWGKNWWIVQK